MIRGEVGGGDRHPLIVMVVPDVSLMPYSSWIGIFTLMK